MRWARGLPRYPVGHRERVNEAVVAATFGYGFGTHAPGKTLLFDSFAATHHLPLRPGTNVALITALAHVVVTEGLVDEAFVAARCDTQSFNDWRAFAQPAGKDGVADYSSAAMVRQATALRGYQARLAAMRGDIVDYRLSLHRRLALTLEQAAHADAEVVATHWRGAGDAERAAHHAVRAAEAAVATLAFRRAAGLYQLALDLGAASSSRATRARIASSSRNAPATCAMPPSAACWTSSWMNSGWPWASTKPR